MPKASTEDKDFIALFEGKGPAQTARDLGLDVRGVYKRRENLEKKLGRQITGPAHQSRTRSNVQHPQRAILAINDGVVLVGSDAHYWPGLVSTAHRAMVRFCDELKPKAVIMNGDVLDGASISRHPPIGWESRPTLEQEVDVCKERLAEIEFASPGARHIWSLGNHDGRFETRLATVAPEYAKLHGVHLQDHFPIWEPAWSCWINDEVVVKHRFKGGINGPHNNTMWAGKSMVTSHFHAGKVTPFSDYNGTRWGVDTGTMAEPNGPQFVDYSEDNPKNHRSGLVALTFRGGRLMWPEFIHAYEEGKVDFRGGIINV